MFYNATPLFSSRIRLLAVVVLQSCAMELAGADLVFNALAQHRLELKPAELGGVVRRAARHTSCRWSTA
jgi:hypothetical protein